MDSSRSKLKIIAGGLVLMALFVYGAYLLLGKISSAQERYIASTSELISLEKKQSQLVQIKEELVATEKNREEVVSSLLASEGILDFIVNLEDIAKKAGLVYEVKISKQVTQESINAELDALRKARRRVSTSEEQEKAIQDKIPGVQFSVDIQGTYMGVIRFLEGIASFPYYSHVEGITISRDAKGGGEGVEAGPKVLKANIQLMVFTK